MRKIILIKWDMQLGPQTVIQYPPDGRIPDRDVLLKIWAHHEMNKNSPIVKYTDDKTGAYYISIVNKDTHLNQYYFLIIQLSPGQEPSKLEEITVRISAPIFAALGTKRLERVVSEIFNSLHEYTEFSREQIFYSLFSGFEKIQILEILRDGVITKDELAKLMKTKYGTVEGSLDILLTPFFYLNLVTEEYLPGIHGNIFLIKDVYICRLPPAEVVKKAIKRNDENDGKFIEKVKEYHRRRLCRELNDLYKISRIMIKKEVFATVRKLGNDRLNTEKFIEGIGYDRNIYEELIEYGIITVIGDYVYLLSEIAFFTFTPIYIIRTLKERYRNGEIGTDQFIRHIELLLNTE